MCEAKANGSRHLSSPLCQAFPSFCQLLDDIAGSLNMLVAFLNLVGGEPNASEGDCNLGLLQATHCDYIRKVELFVLFAPAIMLVL